MALDPPLLRDYRIGMVVGNLGVNGAQLMVIGKKLDDLLKLLPKDEGWIDVYVPGFNLADAESSVARDLRNLLERKHRVHITYIPTRGDHKDGVAEHIVYELATAKRCDEIWCCPAEGQTARSQARVAQVWRLGQDSSKHARFKLIPHWVQVPTATQATQPKGKKSWRDMWNKRSFL